MTLNILAADDSVTMRRILEYTFAGQDAHVVTVDNGDACVMKASQLQPDVIFADVTMQTDGYEVARRVRSTAGLENTAIILMASERHPYDESRGRAAGVDDHVLKPFDTQQVIDQVQRVLGQPRARATAGAAPQPIAAPGPVAPLPLPQMPAPAGGGGVPKHTIAFGMPQISPPGGLPAPGFPGLKAPMPMSPAVQPMQRTSTSYAETPSSPGLPAAPSPARFSSPEPLPRVSAPTPEPLPRVSAPMSAPVSAPLSAPRMSGAGSRPSPAGSPDSLRAELTGRLADLQLTNDQIEGVLELSTFIIERIVWEVVPDLAETIIREELKRLTE